MLVGMAVSAASTVMQSQAQTAAQKGQANADYYAAKQQEAAGTQNASNSFYNTDKYTIGTAIARGASSGHGTLEGSSADVVGDLAKKNVFNADTTMANASNSANGIKYQGDLAMLGAKQTQAAMPWALASTVITGLSKYGQSTGGWLPATSDTQSSPYRYG
jgi:hypothetical protein